MPEEAIWIGLCVLVLGTWLWVLLRFLFQSRQERQREDEDLAEFLVNARQNHQDSGLARYYHVQNDANQ